MKGRVLLTLAATLQLLASCSREDDTVRMVPARRWVETTVAVVAPLGDACQKARLERTAAWFLDNFRKAQLYDTLAVSMKIEWYDEQTADLAELGKTLAGRDDIGCVIGPFANDALAAFAPACQKTLKPLITPTASSEDVIRRYAVRNSSGIAGGNPFLWAITESDVKLTDVLMSAYATFCQAKQDPKTVDACLLSPKNSYGQTFAYWAPFFAENYDIDLVDNVQYANEEELFDYMRSYISKDRTIVSEYLLSGFFTVLDNVSQLYDLALFRRQLLFDKLSLGLLYHTTYDDPVLDELWEVFISSYSCYFALNDLCEEKIDALGDRAYPVLQGYNGFSPYADPTTGFELSYQNRFGVAPLFAECKFYDALLLAGFAACYLEHRGESGAVNEETSVKNKAFNQAIIDITNGSGRTAELSGAVWDATPMEIYLSALERGTLLHFKGASGDISFDPETFTSTTRTTYVQWQILNGKIRHSAYIGDSGSRRIRGTYAAWQYLYDRNTAEADFNQQAHGGAEFHYPAMTGQYAVLVQGSNGIENYRHQSDVLSVYQLLRQNGFPDDHIILVIDHSLATDPRNHEQGIVRASAGGPDLLGGTDRLPAAQPDYDNTGLSATDISHILQGVQTARTPVVLPRDEGLNVLFYWSGHGRNGEFVWRDAPNGQGFTRKLLQQTAQAMLAPEAPTCRKLMMVAEPCYSEGVLTALEGIRGALGISGANAAEQSWADNWSPTALIWLSDRFTQNFVNVLQTNPGTSYRELFLYCAEHTLGSHAKIVNAAYFGNLTTTTPGEFIVYNK